MSTTRNGDRSDQLDRHDLSRRLGERGDLVACKTADVGDAVSNDNEVGDDDLRQLLDAVEEIEKLIDILRER